MRRPKETGLRTVRLIDGIEVGGGEGRHHLISGSSSPRRAAGSRGGVKRHATCQMGFAFLGATRAGVGRAVAGRTPSSVREKRNIRPNPG